jgi:hypothetical protein
MKKHLQLFVFLLAFLGFRAANAQQYPVEATFLLKPPYPVYLFDYANPAGSQLSLQIILKDLASGSRNVRLSFSIEGAGFQASNLPQLVNLPQFTLTPGIPQTLSQADLAPYFKAENLNISPQQYSQALTEGVYTFKVQVIDVLSERAISKIHESPSIWIVVNDPPLLNTPSNQAEINVQNPQNILFQWTPRHKQANAVEYDFVLTELLVPANFSGNLQNLFLSQPAYYQATTSNTTLLYGPAQPPLIAGRTYGFRVKAKAKQGLEEVGIFRNEGYSEVFTFSYSQPRLELSKLSIASKMNGDTIADFNEQNIKFTWQIPSTIGTDLEKIAYKISIAEVARNQTPSQALESARNYTLNGKGEFVYNKTLPKLIIGRTYAVSLLTTDSQNKYKIENDGISPIVSFVFGKNPPELAPIIKLAQKSVSGRLTWTFADSEEKLGRVSGTAQSVWTSDLSNYSETVVVNKPLEGKESKPAEKVMIKVYLDATTANLIGTATTTALGNFNIKFAADAVRGGEIPETMYLRINDGFLGEDFKQIKIAKEAASIDIGDWVLTAPTFRFIPFFKEVANPWNRINLKDPTSGFTFSVYREAALYDKYPLLKYETMTDTKPATETISGKSMVKVAELKAGQVLSGLFYNSTDSEDQFYIKMVGKGLYADIIHTYRQSQKSSITQHTKQYEPRKTDGFVYGKVKLNNKTIGNLNVTIRMSGATIREKNCITNENGEYRINIDDVYYEDKTHDYKITVKQGDVLMTDETFKMSDAKSTEKNFDLKPLGRIMAVVDTGDKTMYALTIRKATAPTWEAIHLYPKNGRVVLFFDETDKATYEIKSEKKGYKDLKFSFTPTITQATKKTLVDDATAFLGFDYSQFSKIITAEDQNIKASKAVKAFAGIASFTNTKQFELNDYEITFQANKKNADINGKALAEVEIYEDNKLLGKTDAKGVFVYTTKINRGIIKFKANANEIKSASGKVYQLLQIAHQSPDLNDPKAKASIDFVFDETLYKTSTITGTVTNRDGEALGNVPVRGVGEGSTRTDPSGNYSLTFLTKNEENFLEIEVEANGYDTKRVYIASSWARTDYVRNIVLEKAKFGPKDNTQTVNTDIKSVSGFEVVSATKATSTWTGYTNESKNATAYGTYDIVFSGTIKDVYGNKYKVTDVKFSKIGSNAPVQKDKSKEITVTAEGGIKLYGFFPITTKGNAILAQEGTLRSSVIEPDMGKMTGDLKGLLDANTKTTISKATNVGHYDNGYIFSSSNAKIQYITLAIEKNKPEDAIKTIINKIRPTFTDAELTTFNALKYDEGGFFINNLLIKSLMVDIKSIQINSVTAVPLMLSGVRMSLMNVKSLRLEDDKINNITIDFSASPRTITVGKGYAKMPFRDVYINTGTVEVTFFTKGAPSKIISEKPQDLTDIEYITDGIKYSNFEQKEVLFTGNIQNRVTMFGRKNAMIPGDRLELKVSENTAIANKKTGWLKPESTDYLYASNTDAPYFAAPEADVAPTITLKGESKIYISPHNVTLAWERVKVGDSTELKIDLKETKVVDWTGDYIKLVNIEMNKTMPVGDDYSTFLKVNYNLSLPIIGGFGISQIGFYESKTNRFYRSQANYIAKAKIPYILDGSLAFSFKYNDNDEMSGFFFAGKGSLLEGREIGLTGGLIKEKDDIIFGLGGSYKTGKGQPTFKILKSEKYKGKSFGAVVLWDGVSNAVAVKVQSTFGWDSQGAGVSQVAADTTAQANQQPDPADPNGGTGGTTTPQQANPADPNGGTGGTPQQANPANPNGGTGGQTTTTNNGNGGTGAIPQQPVVANPQQGGANQQQPVVANPQPVVANPQQPVVANPQQPVVANPQQPVVANPQQGGANQQQPVVATANTPLTPEQIKNNYNEDRNNGSGFANAMKETFRQALGINPPEDDVRFAENIIENGEITVAFGGTGVSLSIGGTYYNKSIKIAEVAASFQIARNEGFRIFIGVPSFFIEKPHPKVKNLRGDFQIDYGSESGFLIMAAAEAEVDAGSNYYKGYLRLALGLNANTDVASASNSLSAGGQVLSSTAKEMIGATSSFNEIVEKSLAQRSSFYQGIPPSYIVNNRFSGLFMSIGIGYFLGKSGDANYAWLTGKYRFGGGIVGKVGVLKDFKSSSWEVSLKVALRLEAMLRVSEPFQADIINVGIDAVTFCAKLGYDGKYYKRALLSVPNVDVVVGGTLVGEPSCNDWGVSYARACFWPRLTYDDAEGWQAKFKLESFEVQKNSFNYYCPIEW